LIWLIDIDVAVDKSNSGKVKNISLILKRLGKYRNASSLCLCCASDEATATCGKATENRHSFAIATELELILSFVGIVGCGIEGVGIFACYLAPTRCIGTVAAFEYLRSIWGIYLPKFCVGRTVN